MTEKMNSSQTNLEASITDSETQVIYETKKDIQKVIIDEYANGVGGFNKEYKDMLINPKDFKTKGIETFFDKDFKDSVTQVQYGQGQARTLGLKNTRWITFNIPQIDMLTRSNPIIKNAINYLATLPLINGIDINAPKDKLSSQELYLVSKKFKTQYRSLKDTLTKSIAYGGAGALIVIANTSKEELARPLIISSIKKNSFVGLKPLSRWYNIEPAMEKGVITEVGEGTGFNDAFYIGYPKYYWVNITGGLSGLDGSLSNINERMLVHASRLILMTTETPSIIETQIERFWGASLIELMYNDLINDRKIWNATIKTAEKNNVGILKMKGLSLAGVLNDAVRKRVVNRVALIKETSSNNIIPIDDNDDFKFAETALTGQASVIGLSNSRLAGSAGVPVSVIFAGEKSDSDDRLYLQSRTQAEDKQERLLRPYYETLLQVIAKSELNKQVKEMFFIFNPIETQTLEDKAKMFLDMTTGLEKLYNIGLDKASIIGMLDDVAKDPMNIAQNINSQFRKYIEDKAKQGEFETKNSDQILVAETLNQQQQKLSGVHNPESDIGGDKGGNKKETKKPLPRNALNREKAKQ